MSAAPIDVDTPIAEPRFQELSPGERRLESLTWKLGAQRIAVQGEKEKIQGTLAETRRRIDFLKGQREALRGETLVARDVMNQAMGLAYALRETVGRLREQETGERDGGGVGELRILMEAEMHRARELAVQLIGDHPYTAEFLQTAVIDEGRAGGLIFEIKSDFGPRADKRIDELSAALRARVHRSHPEYEQRERAHREADDNYRNASADLVNAGNRRDSLLDQVKHALATIAALREAIAKADRVAVRIEEQGQKHEKEDLVRASEAFNEKTAATDKITDELQRGEQNEQNLQKILAQFIQREERLTEAIGKVLAAAKAYSRGVELHSVAPKFGIPLLRVKHNLEDDLVKAKTGIDPTVLQIGDSVRAKIDHTMGYSMAETDTAYTALERAMQKLQELLENLEGLITAAGTSVSGENLNWEAIRELFEGAEKLDLFLKNEWPNLSAGTLEGAEGIERRTREKFAEALKSLSVLGRACHEIKEAQEKAIEVVFRDEPDVTDDKTPREVQAEGETAGPPAPAESVPPAAAPVGEPAPPPETPPAAAPSEEEAAPPEATRSTPPPPPAGTTQPLPRRGRRGAQEE